MQANRMRIAPLPLYTPELQKSAVAPGRAEVTANVSIGLSQWYENWAATGSGGKRALNDSIGLLFRDICRAGLEIVHYSEASKPIEPAEFHTPRLKRPLEFAESLVTVEVE